MKKKNKLLGIELFEVEQRGGKVFYECYAIQFRGKDILYGEYAPFIHKPRWFQVLTTLHRPFKGVSRQGF